MVREKFFKIYHKPPKIGIGVGVFSILTMEFSLFGVTTTMYNKGTIDVGVTNIPVTIGYPNYVKANGTVADGIVFTYFSQVTDSHAVYSDDTPPQDAHLTFDMVESPSNSMEIVVYFESDDDFDDDDDYEDDDNNDEY